MTDLVLCANCFKMFFQNDTSNSTGGSSEAFLI